MKRVLLASLGFSPEFVLRRLARGDKFNRVVVVGLWTDESSWRRVEDAINSVKFFCGKIQVECKEEKVELKRGLVSQLYSILRREAESHEGVELFLTGGPRIVVVGFIIAGLMLEPRLQERVDVVVWGEAFEGSLRVNLKQLSTLLTLDEAEARIVLKLAEEPRGLRASDLVRMLEIPKSTLYKKLRRLTEARVVTEEEGVYKLASAILEVIK